MTMHLDAPDIGEIEKQYVGKALDSGYVSTFGPLVGEFERQFAALVGVPRAVAIQSGTAALHMALHILGIGKGDEVIVPATTFAATLHAVMYVGATPVIVDVDPLTWCLSVDAFKAAIGKHTKAVIPVHLYGNLCNMTSINTIAKEKQIIVIEDATESLGATLDERHAGTLGDIGCYSFNGNKLMTTGSGGMFVSQDQKILDRLVYIINQANPREGWEGFNELGFNYRMPNLNAALGMAQIKRLEEFLLKKKEFHRIYEDELRNLDHCSFQKAYPGIKPSWWFTAVLFKDQASLLKTQEYLTKAGVPVRRLFKPLGSFAYAGNFAKGPCPHAWNIYERGLCLPSSTLNRYDDIKCAAEHIKKSMVKGGAC